MSKAAVVAVMVATFACAPVPATQTVSVPLPTAQPRAPRELLWVRTAAEHEALFHQTFRAARERLASLASRSAVGTWAVIADADETLVDNSEYQRRILPSGSSFDSAAWNAWVRERAAPALPGAVDFARSVRAMGGHLVVVTNRDEQVCEDTRANLAAIGIEAAAVLCRTSTSDKNPRFEAVRTGSAVPNLPAMQTLMWVGDNIQDFPQLTQSIRNTRDPRMALFGDRYFVLPNPMYGSFERNTMR